MTVVAPTAANAAASKRPRPVVLCILDGWGEREDTPDNAITRAKTPVFNNLKATCPHALLDASEEHVGLPAGQMGNSEVGHMNLGAGRVVFQDLPLIDRAIVTHELENNSALLELVAKLQRSGGTCHLMGLVSDGGVHSHIRHVVELARIIAASNVPVAIHAITDGRDTPPQNAKKYIMRLLMDIFPMQGVRLATLCGRYWAMDRDNRWDRVKKAYDLITTGVDIGSVDPITAITDRYEAGETDEFLAPITMSGYTGMHDGDGILFANYRSDRAREILLALLDPDFSGFPRPRHIQFAVACGMMEYSTQHSRLMDTLFPPKKILNGLGEVIAAANLKQLRLAETEKYPHVTFFFNGGREEPYQGEERILVSSPKVATYDLQPEMSAREVTDRAVAAVESGKFDLIIINYANPDMVGHTGIMEAAVKAVEALDTCLSDLTSAVQKAGGVILVTADHGNCEVMKDPVTGEPHKAHTTNRVPVILFNAPAALGITGLQDGKLADVAPTLLELMRLPCPDEMDGKSLLVKE